MEATVTEPEEHLKEAELLAAAVLEGGTSYDHVGPDAQWLVREAWASRIAARREALDLEQQFLAGGIVSWSEADPDGNLVIRDAQSAREDRQHE